MTAATTAANDGGGVRRFVPPPRAAIDPQVFAQPLFAGLQDFRDLLDGPHWPSIAALDARLSLPGWQLVEQDAALLADGLHYEARIAQGRIATRADNWHDLFNALVWASHPQLKRALNVQQCRHIESHATRPAQPRAGRLDPVRRNRRDRACVGDVTLLRAWDGHDWPALFEPTRCRAVTSPLPRYSGTR